MADIQIGDSMVSWVQGLLAFIAFVSIILTFYFQLKKLKYQTDSERQAMVNQFEKEKAQAIQNAVIEAQKESEMTAALRDLQRTVNDSNTSMQCLKQAINQDITILKKHGTHQAKVLVSAIASVKSAHKRIDDHRLYEHGIKPDKNFTEVLEIRDNEEEDELTL